MSSSYSSYWPHFTVHRFNCICVCVFCFFTLHVYCIIVTRWGGPDGIETNPYDPILLQCFDPVGWVFWPVKTVPNMTDNVCGGTLNLTELQVQAMAVPANCFRATDRVGVQRRSSVCHVSRCSWTHDARLAQVGVRHSRPEHCSSADRSVLLRCRHDDGCLT